MTPPFHTSSESYDNYLKKEQFCYVFHICVVCTLTLKQRIPNVRPRTYSFVRTNYLRNFTIVLAKHSHNTLATGKIDLINSVIVTVYANEMRCNRFSQLLCKRTFTSLDKLYYSVISIASPCSRPPHQPIDRVCLCGKLYRKIVIDACHLLLSFNTFYFSQ